MAKFPIQRAREELGFTPATETLRNVDIGTREETVGEAVSGFGAALGDLGLRLDVIQADVELSEAKRRAAEIGNTIDDRIRAAADFGPESIQGIRESINAELQSLTPKNRRAQRGYAKFLNQNIPVLDERIQQGMLKRASSEWEAEGQLLFNDIKRTGNSLPYQVHVSKGKILFGLSASEINLRRQAAIAQSVESSIDNAVATENIGQLQSLLEQGITGKQKIKIKTILKKVDKANEEKRVSSVQQLLLSHIEGLPLEEAQDIIDQSPLSFAEKGQVETRHNNRNRIKNNQQAEQIKVNQRRIRDAFIERILSGKENYTELQTEIDIVEAQGNLEPDAHAALSRVLEEPVPENSGPFAISDKLQAEVDVGRGVITKDEGIRRVLEILPLLDKEDREAAFVGVTKAFAAGQSTAIDMGYKGGDSLMSPVFRKVVDLVSLHQMFGDDKNFKQIERQFIAEFNLKSAYKRALNQWFVTESQKRTVSISDIQNEILQLLPVYQNVKRTGDIEQIELFIQAEPDRVKRDSNAIARPEDSESLKRVSDMTLEEVKAEKARILKERNR